MVKQQTRDVGMSTDECFINNEGRRYSEAQPRTIFIWEEDETWISARKKNRSVPLRVEYLNARFLLAQNVLCFCSVSSGLGSTLISVGLHSASIIAIELVLILKCAPHANKSLKKSRLFWFSLT